MSVDSYFEAEYRVIGALLQDNSLLAEVDLTPFDFCDGVMGQVYAAIRNLDRERKPFDVFTVGEELERTTNRDWIPTIASIVKDCPSIRNVGTYAEYIKKYRRNREARDIANRLLDDIGSDEGAVDRAISELMGLDHQKDQTLFTMKEAAEIAYKQLCDTHSTSGKLMGVSTGLKDLDASLGGFQRGDLVIVGARPAAGKTAFLLNCAIRAQVCSAIQSAEMSAGQLAQRSISNVGSIDSWNLRTAELDEDEWTRVSNAFGRLVDLPIHIDDRASPSIVEVQRLARKLKQKFDIQIFYLDYLQRITGSNVRAPTVEQVTEVAKGLKTIAKELQIPVVALAQVNRSVEQRQNKRPLMSDLSDCSQIEKEADEILMLYRDEVYNEDSEDKGIAEINIVKNRHGPTGSVRVAWTGPYLRFSDLSPWGVG